MQEPTSLSLLAPDGIVYVTFGQALTADQSLALLQATQAARTVDELRQTIENLGEDWGIPTQAEIISRSTRVWVVPQGARQDAE